MLPSLTEILIGVSQFLYYFSILLLTYIGALLLVIYLKYFPRVEKKEKRKIKGELPFVSVVVPLYNDEEEIVYTLSSILTVNYPKEKLEVIVVDDASKDRSYERAKMFEEFGVKVIRLKENRGAANAKNVGIKNSSKKAEIIITIDSDSVMEENAILNFVKSFDSQTGAISGAVRTKKPKSLLEKMQEYEYDIILFVRKIFEFLHSIPVTPGGMSAFSKKALEKVGGFEEKSLTEDQEIAFKMHKHNYKVKVSLEAISYTTVPKTFKAFLNQRVRWIRGGIYNRIIHKNLFSLKYGDFALLGFTLDFVYAIPVFSAILSKLIEFSIKKPYLFVFKIGLVESLLIYIDFILLLSIFLFFLYFYWSAHMINVIRRKAKTKEISLKELPSLILYNILYPFVWGIIWPLVIIKEIKSPGYKWGTR